MNPIDYSIIDKSWTLFLDRDGVINVRKMDEYVLTPEEFILLDGYHEAIKKLTEIFGLIIIVTNQQGVGKGLMSENDLAEIHHKLKEETSRVGGHINAIYFAPQLKSQDDYFRKPGIGMAMQAKKDFPQIDFSKSIMVGDTVTDLEFGEKTGMKTVYISKRNDLKHLNYFSSLLEFSKHF